MLAVMHARGSIGAAARQAALELHAVILTGSRPVLALLGTLGVPAGPCLVQVLGLGWSIKQFAQQGWQGQKLNQETASGILVAALTSLADGKARLLLDRALEGAAPRGIEA
jgi:hypothetical protein